MNDAYDVFFSYHTRDHAVVERVARSLTKQGIRVFLDRWYLTPGQPWPQALEQTLASCSAVAFFVGAEGLGPWQQRERDLALDRQAREPGFPVIPVLLTRADPALGFLKLNTWVDLSENVADPETLATLTAAIRGEPPGPLARQRSEAVRSAVCPYRGLQPFREEDEPFFFGRTSFAETLTASVLRHPFVAVVGASGSGKSSVVRAGLIPRLRRGGGDLVWDAAILVPTDRPLISLSAALLPLLEPDLSEVKRLAEVADLASHLQTGKIDLRDVVARVLANQSGTDRLLVFVDQWEELYTLCGDQSVRQAFIGQLISALATDKICVVLTIRGDFMGRALNDRAFADQVQNGVVTIGPMTRDELAETIVEPAAKTGLSFETGLPEMILDEVGDEPGGLPLLEFLLEGLWAERRGQRLTHEAYTRLGRVSGAIAHRAEEVFERNLNEAERQAAQRLLIRMVRPGEGVEDTRRRAALPAGDAVVEATIYKLAKERLVVTERDAGSGEVTVEVAHEALIRRWQRLRTWIDVDREFLRTRQRIEEHARLWEDEGRRADRLLPAGRPLAEGEDLLAERRHDLEPMLVEYIQASAAAAQAEENAKRSRERRELRRLRLGAVMLALFALVAAAFGWYAIDARDRANLAFTEQSLVLVDLANRENEAGNTAEAMRLALEALPENLNSPDRPYVPEAELALARAVWNHYDPIFTVTHDSKITATAFSPDGELLYTGFADGSAELREISSGKSASAMKGHDGRISRAAFGPSGDKIATTSLDGTIRIWDARSGSPLFIVDGEAGPLIDSYFDEERLQVTTASLDGLVITKDLNNNTISSFSDPSGGFNNIAFSSDGKLAVTASADKRVRVIDLLTGKLVYETPPHPEPVNAVAFDPHNRLIVTGCSDNVARVWDIIKREMLYELRGHANSILRVSFSPDGSAILTGSMDGSARLFYNISPDPEELPTVRNFADTEMYHSSGIVEAIFSKDGNFILTADNHGIAKIWRFAKILYFTTEEQYGGNLSYYPDGITLAAINADGQRAVTVNSNKAIVWTQSPWADLGLSAEVKDGGLIVHTQDGVESQYDFPELTGQSLINIAHRKLIPFKELSKSSK